MKKVCNGTFYSAEALDGAILALEYARVNKTRIRIFYAYKTTEEKENGVRDSDKKTCALLYKTSFREDFKVYATCKNEDFQEAVRYLGNLSRYTQGVRFTKGGR